MNLADLTTLLTFLGCGLSAALAATVEKAGWFTAPLVIAGLALGFGFAWIVRKSSCWLLDSRPRNTEATAHTSRLLACLFLPACLAIGAVLTTAWLTTQCARHLL